MSRMQAVANAGDLSGLFGTSEATQPGPDATGPQGSVESVEQSTEKPAVDDVVTESKAPEEEVKADKSEKEPEDKEKDGKKDKKESEITKINNQIRALNRKQAAQAKVEEQQLARAKELQAYEHSLKEQTKALEEVEKLPALEILMRIAEYKKVPFKDLLRQAINHAATGEPGESEEKKPEEKKPEKDPELLALKQELEALKNKESEKELKAREEWENSLVEGYVGSCMELLNENDYPILAGEDPDELMEEIISVSEMYAEKTGMAPEVEEVVQYLEAKHEQKAKSLSERLQKKSSKDKISSETQKVSTPATGAGSPATTKKVEAPKAVTNNMASERGSATDYSRKSGRDRLDAATAFLASISGPTR